MRPLLQLALVISCFIALKNIPDSESSVLYKTPFRELTEIEKEKTAIDDYLIALYHLQFVRKEYDSRNSICTSMERLHTFFLHFGYTVLHFTASMFFLFIVDLRRTGTGLMKFICQLSELFR